MSSRYYPKETSKSTALTMSQRLLLVLLVWGIEVLYAPTSSRISGGIEPKLPIDIFPIWAIWVVPYVLCYLFWIFSFLWITFKMEDRLFRAFAAASLLVFSLGMAIFIFFPTYVKPATLVGNDIFTSLLRFFHYDLGRYDAFPSGHIYITTLLVLFFNRWYPRQKFIWNLTLVIVAFSTLFTGQHYLLDVVGGYILALTGYYFGLWWAGFVAPQNRIDERSGKRIPSSSMD